MSPEAQEEWRALVVARQVLAFAKGQLPDATCTRATGDVVADTRQSLGTSQYTM